MRRSHWFIAFFVIAGIVIAGIVVAAVALFPGGVEAVIRNTGRARMRDIRVIVTGHSYAIGDLAPGQSRSVRVNPDGESHIVLTYTDASGVGQRLTVDCYFESGYSGSITVEVAEGTIAKVDDRIEI